MANDLGTCADYSNPHCKDSHGTCDMWAPAAAASEGQETDALDERCGTCGSVHRDHYSYNHNFVRRAGRAEGVELPPRPKREYRQQFSTALTGYHYVQYSEFKRYADALEAKVSSLQRELEEARKGGK